MSRLEIANIALFELGQDPIADLNGNGANEKRMNARINSAIRFVMEQHPWNELISRARLPLADKEVIFGRRYPYALPAGGEQPYCLRVLEATDELYGDISWRRERRFIYTDGGQHPSGQAAGPLLLLYIGFIDNEAEWSPKLIEASGRYLASVTAFPITKDKALAKEKKTEWQDFLKVARSLDGQEQSEYPIDTDVLLRSRL